MSKLSVNIFQKALKTSLSNGARQFSQFQLQEHLKSYNSTNLFAKSHFSKSFLRHKSLNHSNISNNMASPNTERTFIMCKPDAVQRGIVGEIIKRFEAKGFKLVAMKFMWASKELLEKHYADLSSRPFFPGLVTYMSSGPVVPMVWEGLNAVKTGRVMLGATNPADSAPGTIRGDLCVQVGRNIIHGSDSVESAKKEIALWFGDNELVDWKPATVNWVYE